ncbi:hypothetical protein [Kibdelosporangium aridum]|uniref:hypothetical protein n=1 Tax=Kibdelosporangium aridum TaxID=2030 RepID=UPI000527C6EC
MVKRRTKLAMAAIASIGGVIAGGRLYLRHQLEPEKYLGVTLYSEPHYRGRSQTLTRADTPCSVSETGLPRVGSIRVQRYTGGFRPAVLELPLAWGWVRSSITSLISRDLEGARESGSNAADLMRSALDPRSWHAERDPALDVQSWVRLWADRPTYPADDELAGSGEQPWYDVLTDTPDLGPWTTRARYLELGVRTP